MAAEAPGHTLNATGLVHEAYLRLVGDQQFDGRGHLFAAAATAMRRILIERARKKLRRKHGGDRQRREWHPRSNSMQTLTANILPNSARGGALQMRCMVWSPDIDPTVKLTTSSSWFTLGPVGN
jgi:hypothetical protein